MHAVVEAGPQSQPQPLAPTARPPAGGLARPLLVATDALVAGACAAAGGLAPTLAVPAWVVALHSYGLHRSGVVASPRAELVRLVHAVAAGAVLLSAGAHLLELSLSRPDILRAALLVLAGLGVERSLARLLFRQLRRRGRLLRPVAVVGTGPEAAALASSFHDEPQLGYRVVAFVGEQPVADPRFDGTPLVPLHGKVPDELHLLGARGVVVATTDVGPDLVNRLARRLTDGGLHVELSSSLVDVDARRLNVRPLGRFAVVSVAAVPRHGRPLVAKRVFDVVVAGLGLVALAPGLAFVAAAVKLDSPGPVLFRQERVGRRGRRFTMLKFRSMVADAEAQRAALQHANQADGPLFKVRHDPRVTRVGRVLRRLSIDELPQLVNVVRGEMSLVGPRPALPSEVVQWEPELFDRLRVPPGITGLWQVRGRSQSRFADYRRWDLYYVDNWSPLHDVAILLRTIPALLSRRGAY